MKIWIVWLPNVWKSTLFNALTNNYAADAANFPFCTIEPNVWIVDVKDPRVDEMAKISNTQKIIYATTKFVDIAGIVKWASQGQWLWNKFLANIREVDAIVQVVRYFQDSEITHVDWSVDPMRDIETINAELLLADLEFIEWKYNALERKAKMVKDDELQQEFWLLTILKEGLWKWILSHNLRESLSDKQLEIMDWYHLLSDKPFIYCINVSEENLKDFEQIKSDFEKKLSAPVAVVCAKFEADMIWMESSEKLEFIREVVWQDVEFEKLPTLDTLIKLAFDTVGLMYYFTTWEKETRAWTIHKNSPAPVAAWAIHWDIQKWFIKAEVINYQHFVDCWGWSKAKEKWHLKLEWKEYIVQDWDIIVFKHNK